MLRGPAATLLPIALLGGCRLGFEPASLARESRVAVGLQSADTAANGLTVMAAGVLIPGRTEDGEFHRFDDTTLRSNLFSLVPSRVFDDTVLVYDSTLVLDGPMRSVSEIVMVVPGPQGPPSTGLTLTLPFVSRSESDVPGIVEDSILSLPLPDLTFPDLEFGDWYVEVADLGESCGNPASDSFTVTGSGEPTPAVIVPPEWRNRLLDTCASVTFRTHYWRQGETPVQDLVARVEIRPTAAWLIALSGTPSNGIVARSPKGN